jgi:hypothetical protein
MHSQSGAFGARSVCARLLQGVCAGGGGGGGLPYTIARSMSRWETHLHDAHGLEGAAQELAVPKLLPAVQLVRFERRELQV